MPLACKGNIKKANIQISLAFFCIFTKKAVPLPNNLYYYVHNRFLV